MQLLITVPWDAEQFKRIQQAFPGVDFITALSEDKILQAVGDVEVVFGDLSRNAFLAAKKLRWVQCHGAGVNNLVAIPELVKSDVLVTNTRGAHAPTIAEHVLGTLIALTRKLPELYLAQTRKEWINWSEWSKKVGARPVGLFGMTLGVIGLGNIGRAVAERAAAFQMKIIAVDILDVPRPPYVAELWKIDGLSKLLQQSDVVVVTIPGTPETNGLLGRQALALMKPSAYLCVVSRGGIIDEEALASMLTEGRLAGAAVDVFKKEPLPADSPLWSAPNLILTPHVCGKSENTTAAATSIFMENLACYLDHKPLNNLVNKEMGF
jgi:phosphoglycerate dehydrogenase-like enzyme